MASPSDSISMALFCDFENVALGVRDAQYEKFDIKPILERLLLKGSIVVKKAYCDWERYKGFKATMHEANFELIEIPHVRQSGKNSADIRLVVDALDLCYTKSHVNTFVIISGDSDFSPLVSKLRENNKQVIGVGVKQSTSDLLIANCDEFIFYDDLVRENQRAQARRQSPGASNPPAQRRSPEEERSRKETQDARRTQGVELAAETFEALLSERGDSGKIWASVLKEAIKRRKPDFSEGRYGFRTFGNLLEEAQARGLLEFGRDEKSGAYVYRGLGAPGNAAPSPRQEGVAERFTPSGPARHDFHAVAVAAAPEPAPGGADGHPAGRARGRRGQANLRSEGYETLGGDATEQPSDAQEAVVPERPASRYFSQSASQEPTVAEHGADDMPASEAHREDAADTTPAPAYNAPPADESEAAAPRRGRSRSPAATGESPGRSRAPRARSSRAAPAAAPSVMPSAADTPTPPQESAVPQDGPQPASAARPRSRSRKSPKTSAE